MTYSINSRNKGKVGEREWALFLRSHGFTARRGVQYHGGPDSPDVVCAELQHHFEVKRVEALNIEKAMGQAKSEAPQGSQPVVAHRRNRAEWLVTMRADDWIALVKAGLHGKVAPPGAGAS